MMLLLLLRDDVYVRVSSRDKVLWGIEEEKETKMTERRELQKVRKEITATLRGIEDSFDLVLEDAEDLKVGAYENAENFLGKLRALSLAMSRVV